MSAQVLYLVLDTGEKPMWTPDRRRQLGRCQSCEWHPPTQGHHPWCPREAAIDARLRAREKHGS